MKRFVFLSSALFLLLVPGRSQVLFHDDFQATTNHFSVGDVASSWTLYNDNNVPVSSPEDLSAFKQAWNVLERGGERFAASVSFFVKNEAADRWMVTPAIDLTAASKPVLVFRAKRMDTEYRDGLQVKLSVSGKEKQDFTYTLQSLSTAPAAWTYYTVDLSEHVGKTVFIAFVQNSLAKYMVGVDDVAVLETESVSGLLTALSVASVVKMQGASESVPVQAALLNTGSEPIVSYTLCVQTDQGEVVKENVSNVNIEPAKTAAVNTSLVLNSEGTHSVSVWVENINGKDVVSNTSSSPIYSIKAASLPHKNLLVEIFSSGTCSSCAPLNAWLHPIFIDMKANDPDNSGNISVVKYQVNIPAVGDPAVTEQTSARGGLYGIIGAPSVYMNGRTLVHDTTIGRVMRDSLAVFLKTEIPTGISASFERNEGTFTIHTKVTNYLPDVNNYRLLVCIVEDTMHLPNTQGNGEKDFYNVTRYMLPDVVGASIVPETLGEVIEKDFEYTFDESSPRIFSSYDNMGVVVFLQNAKNYQVSQAFYLKAGGTAANDKKLVADRSLSLYPNPAGERCSVAFDAAIGGNAMLRVFNGQGKTVYTESIMLQAGKNVFELETAAFTSGLYFVQIENEQGVFTHKLMKR